MLCATSKHRKTHNVCTFIGSISKHASKLVVSGEIYPEGRHSPALALALVSVLRTAQLHRLCVRGPLISSRDKVHRT